MSGVVSGNITFPGIKGDGNDRDVTKVPMKTVKQHIIMRSETPAEIYWDDYHDTDNDSIAPGGNYEYLANELRSAGHTIYEKGVPITLAGLAGYDVLVIVDPENPLLTSEISVIQTWVEQSHGLFVLGENDDAFDGESVNDLLVAYKISILGDISPDVADKFVTHPVTEGVSTLGLDGCGYLTVSSPSIKLGYADTGECVLAAHESSGKVVVFPDSCPLKNDYIYAYDEVTLALNTIDWLAAGGKSFGHGGRVTSVAFSPDGRLLASSSDDKTIRIWNVTTGQEVLTLTGHKGRVNAVVFSPDGKLLASAGGPFDNTVKLWNVSTGRELYTLEGNPSRGWVEAVAFSPDGLLLASIWWGEIKLWDVATGEEVRTISDYNPVESVAFSPDGKLLASGGYDPMFKLWEVATGREVHKLAGHTVGWGVNSVAFSPNGQILASGDCGQSEDGLYCVKGEIKLWEVTTGSEVLTLTAHNGSVSSVAFSPYGKLLASGSCGRGDDRHCVKGEIRLWDATTGGEVCTLTAHNGSVSSVAFSPDGKLLASSSSYERTIKLWDVSDFTLAEEEFIDELKRAIQDQDLEWVAGPTSVSGLMTKEEARELLGANEEPPDANPPIWTPPLGPIPEPLPEAFDWRNNDGNDWTTPVRNQGRCGSCVAHAALAVFESVFKIAKNDFTWNPDLSEQCLFSCGCGRCCNKGWHLV